MADLRQSTDGPSPLSQEGYDESLLPDYDVEFLSAEDLQAFASALSAPEHSPSTDDLGGMTSRQSVVDIGNGPSNGSVSGSRKGSFAGLFSRSPSVLSVPLPGLNTDTSSSSAGVGEKGKSSRESLFITAQNDWAPVTPTKPTGGSGGSIKAGGGGKKRKKDRKRKQRRSSDETREGYLYSILAWPLLAVVGAWIAGLGVSYLSTRLYIWLYEHFVAWRGKRQKLRKMLQATDNYKDWVKEARELDHYLGNESWKEVDEYAYYDHKTVRRVVDQMKKFRRKVEGGAGEEKGKAVEDLKALVEACVKNNFVGVENSRLYSQTYYGTKNLVQEFDDEGLSFYALLL